MDFPGSGIAQQHQRLAGGEGVEDRLGLIDPVRRILVGRDVAASQERLDEQPIDEDVRVVTAVRQAQETDVSMPVPDIGQIRPERRILEEIRHRQVGVRAGGLRHVEAPWR